MSVEKEMFYKYQKNMSCLFLLKKKQPLVVGIEDR